jgi:hypothetical protein
MNPWIPFVQIALLAAGPASPPTAKAGPDAAAADGSRPIAIDIDTSKLGEFGTVFDRRLEHELRAAAKQRGIAVVPQTRGRIRVEVTDTSGKGTAFEFAVETTPWAADAGRTSERGTCAPCTEEMTVAKITEALGARFDALADTAEEAPPTPAVTAGRGPAEGPSGPRDDGEKVRKRPVAVAGYVFLGLGAASVVGGAVMVALPDKTKREAEDHARYEGTSTRTPGIVLLAAGGAAVIAGAIMAFTRPKQGGRRVTVTPAVARRFAGLGVGGRF